MFSFWQLYWKLWTVTSQTACHLDWSEHIMFIAFVSFYYLFIALWYHFRSVHSYCDVHNPSPSPRDFNLTGPCDNPVLWACGSWGNEMPRFVYVLCSSLPRGIGGHLSKDVRDDEDKGLRFRDGVKKKVQRCQMNFEAKTFLHLVTLWPPHRSKANIVSEDSLEHYVLKHIGWIKHRLFQRVIPERRQVIMCVELRGWRLII